MPWEPYEGEYGTSWRKSWAEVEAEDPILAENLQPVNGFKYNDGAKYRYQVKHNPKYGFTVWRNENKGSWNKGTVNVDDLKPPKQEKLADFTPNKSDVYNTMFDKLTEIVMDMDARQRTQDNKLENMLKNIQKIADKVGAEQIQLFEPASEQLKNNHGNENQGAGTEGAYVEAGDAENQDYSGEGDGADEVRPEE